MKKLWFFLKNLTPSVKASFAFMFASIVTSGISYLMAPIYTRLLSPEQYGLTSVFMTWMDIFGVIAMFCLSYGVFNNGMLDYEQKRDEFSLSLLVLSNVITLCFGCLCILLYPLYGKYLGFDVKYVILMNVIFLFQPAYNFWTARQRYEIKYKYVVFWSILSALISPMCAVGFIIMAPNDKFASRIFGAWLPLLVIYIGFYVYILYQGNFKIKIRYWKNAFLFNLPLIPHYLSSFLLGSADKIMIAWLIGEAEVAFYSIAYSVASVVIIVWNAVNSSLLPYTYEKCKIKDYESISKVTFSVLIIFSVTCVAVMMLAPEVVSIMATKDYQEAVYAIPPIIGGVFFQVQYYMYANIIYYYKKPKYVMYASVVSTVTNVVLNYILIPRFGYLVAGYTTLASYLLQAILDYLAMRKVVGIKIYNMKNVGLLTLAVVGTVMLSVFSYKTVLLRYIIVASIAVIAFARKKKIIKLVLTMKSGD